MFVIRRIFDDVTPADRDAAAQVRKMLREKFLDMREEEIGGLGQRLRNPMKQRFRTVLFVAERRPGETKGFALLMYAPKEVLSPALSVVREFRPQFLVVAFGLDTAKLDPTGSWSLEASDLRENGRLIGRTGLPVLVVQEGGHRTRTLGRNARAFFEGLDAGAREVRLWR